jgi:mannose-6-phosphate isomerase-like protein (cupin superfamily)
VKRRPVNQDGQAAEERRITMGKITKGTAAEHVEAPGFEGNYGETEGYTVGFEQYTEHSDMAPLFVGLPDDRCQCSHWGYVVRGKLVYHTAGEDIEITDGEAYYVGPGHTPEIFPDTEIVEFSPTKELQQTMEVVTKNMEASG